MDGRLDLGVPAGVGVRVMSTDLRLAALLKLGECVICGRKQLAGAVPVFYTVTISRGGFRQDAVRRAAGLEMMVGGPLAAVMGSDEPLAEVIDGPHSVFVHEECAGEIGHLLRLFPPERESAA